MAFGKKPLNRPSNKKRYALEQLEKMGRFNLRVLAQELGFFETEETRNAFIAMAAKEQARLIHITLNPEPSPLVKEMEEVRIVEKYRHACGELAVVMSKMRRK